MRLWELRREAGFAASILRGRPFQCLIQVTNRCNMTCSFCDFWPNGAPPKQELSLDEYRRLEEDLSGLGTFMVSIEGGEPFLRPDLVEIIRIFGRRHIPILFTNGWYATERSARELFEAGLSQAGVSIDYAEASRHDAKRGLAGATERAWRAVGLFRAAAQSGRRVHVMTVLMKDNQEEIEPLLRQSAAVGVGHCLTLLSREGYRRGKGTDEWPSAAVAGELLGLWRRYPHFMAFRGYLERIAPFLSGAEMPRCRAGEQSFNLDHLGNVSPCIEKIDLVMGNVRQAPLAGILAARKHLDGLSGCQDCWTFCRGFGQIMGQGGTLAGWRDMVLRMRSA